MSSFIEISNKVNAAAVSGIDSGWYFLAINGWYAVQYKDDPARVYCRLTWGQLLEGMEEGRSVYSYLGTGSEETVKRILDKLSDLVDVKPADLQAWYEECTKQAQDAYRG